MNCASETTYPQGIRGIVWLAVVAVAAALTSIDMKPINPWLQFWRTPPKWMIIDQFKFPPPAAATIFVTGVSAGGNRNDYTGTVGCQLVIGASPITVTELGKWAVNTPTGTHTVYLASSTGTSLGSVSINMTGTTTNTFKYGTLSSPVVLSASTTYYLMVVTTSGGDLFLDDSGTTVTTTAVASVTRSAFGSSQGGTCTPNAAANHTYGALNLKYTL